MHEPRNKPLHVVAGIPGLCAMTAADSQAPADRARLREILVPGPSLHHSRTLARLVKDGVFASRSSGDIEIGEDLWSSGPQEDRTWLWSLHSFQPLDALIAEGEGEILGALVRSWRAKFEDAPVEDDFP